MIHELEVLLDNIFSNGAEEDEKSYENNKAEVLRIFNENINYTEGEQVKRKII